MAEEIDLERLRELYRTDEAARSFLDHASSRKRKQTETKVHRVLQILAGEGKYVSRQELVNVFKALQECGCGRFVAGRWSWPSRFLWDTSIISVGKSAIGEIEEIEALPDEIEDVRDDDGYEEDDSWLTHTFHLRPDTQIEISLPMDLSPEEGKRLAAYVSTLAFGEDV